MERKMAHLGKFIFIKMFMFPISKKKKKNYSTVVGA